jgi:hypothetical protein
MDRKAATDGHDGRHEEARPQRGPNGPRSRPLGSSRTSGCESENDEKTVLGGCRESWSTASSGYTARIANSVTTA